MTKTSHSRRPRWHKSSQWVKRLQQELLIRGRKRYSLSISEDHPFIGATSDSTKTVSINPFQIPFVETPNERKTIRHANSQSRIWEQKVAIAVLNHEIGHVLYSGNKPQEPLLGWLWNCLEDERIERNLVQAYPELEKLFNFVGDAAWYHSTPSQEILAACLYWRWEWDKTSAISKFSFAHLPDSQKWEKIRPLVESAWVALDSHCVEEIAKEILLELALPFDQLPDNLPFYGLLAPEGDFTDSSVEQDSNQQENNPDSDKADEQATVQKILNSGLSSLLNKIFDRDTDNLPEADPQPILQAIEPYARDLAHLFQPPSPFRLKRPHFSRGEINLERALEGHPRPFDWKQQVSLPSSLAILLVVDQSGSMEGEYLEQAITTALLLDRAAEIAAVPLGVWGYNHSEIPFIHRPLSIGNMPQARRRIAGMEASGGTELSPVFRKAIEELVARTEKVKLLILYLDGELDSKDATRVQKEIHFWHKQGIFVQTIFIGDDHEVIESNRKIFGNILACQKIQDLTALLRSWLFALL